MRSYNYLIAPLADIRLYILPIEDIDNPNVAPIQDGEEVLFDKDQHYAVRCEAYGSNPAADVTISIGQNDISSQFERTATDHMSGEDSDGAIRAVTYDVVMSNVDFTVTRNMHKNTLTCSGHVPRLATRSVTAKCKYVLYFKKMVFYVQVFNCYSMQYNN